MRTPLIIAHRGASKRAPENTIAAFKLAIDSGADGVEFDVRLAADGVPVVIHDGDLRRTGGRAIAVATTGSIDLANCDVGSWFNKKFPNLCDPSFSDEGVPTLARVLDLYRSTSGPIFVELKCDTPEVVELVGSVCSEIARRHDIRNRVIIKSFRPAAVLAAKQCMPEIATAALFEPTIMNLLRRRRNIVDLALELRADRISVHYTLASKTLVEYAHSKGLGVTIWTVDDRRWIARSRERSIDTLITNDPISMM